MFYYLQVPDEKATYTPITEVKYLDYDSTYKWYGKYSLDIQVSYDKISLINEITIDLNSLTLTKNEEQKRKDIIKLIQKIQSEKDKEKSIKYCIKAIDALYKIKSTPTTLIHLKLIKLLKICERGRS
ncbi:hypothetical protein HZA55_06285 [Candidatus Poribacteria bacterium]|nr:hypothetical protein [Candidatus Poribacteria bacterium]